MSGGWNTIESDAGVFTYLINNLGVKDVQFEELIALDADYLTQLRPVYGVIFLFKYPTGSPPPQDKPLDGTFDYPAASSLFFASQTIQNACGTQALLSVLLNKDDELDLGPQLTDFKDFTSAFPSQVRPPAPFPPLSPSHPPSLTNPPPGHPGEDPKQLRGETLSNSELIRTVHNSFARSTPFLSEATHPATDDDDVYHFIAYTSLHNTLYELDGLQPAPISHGPCLPADFPAKVIPVLQRRIARYPADEIRFNLLACVRDLGVKAREEGDVEGLERERVKRRGWRWENALRRHNFVGFVGGVLEGVVGGKIGEKGEGGGFEGWVEEGKKRTRERRGKGEEEG